MLSPILGTQRTLSKWELLMLPLLTSQCCPQHPQGGLRKECRIVGAGLAATWHISPALSTLWVTLPLHSDHLVPSTPESC